MICSNYKALKSAGKASITKETEDSVDTYYLTQKQFNSQTGEALADMKVAISLAQLEAEKARQDVHMSNAKAESDELSQMITDFKAL